MKHRALDRFLRWWYSIPLGVKGVVLLLVPAAALFAALIAVYGVEKEAQRTYVALSRAYDIRSALADLRGALLDAQTDIAAYVSSGEGRFQAMFDEARQRVGEAQARLTADTGNDPQARAALEDIRRQTAAVMDRFDAIRRGRETAGLDLVKAARADLQQGIAQLGDLEDRRFIEARTRRDRARGRLFRILFLCATLGPLTSMLIYAAVISRMLGRLRRVQENARRLAQGLELEPAPSGTDEIAMLAGELANAAFRLRDRERDLLESERRYRDLFDRAPVPYEETDARGAIRRINEAACTLLRCTPSQMIGRSAWHLAAPGGQETLGAAMMQRIADGSETAPFECEYQLEDGTHIAVEVRESLIRNERGQVTGTVRSLLDVTERNVAATAARKVSQYAMELRIKNEQLARALDAARSATVAKSRFLASVSHELRTPLNGIIGFSELLYDQKLGPLAARQRDVLDDILTSSRHLLRMIGDILDLSKVEAGRMEFYPETHRLEQLVAEVRDVIRPLSEKKNLALTVDVPAHLQAVLDGSRFKQVVYNYLSNAVKFTPDGGSIAVRVRTEGTDRFRLEVEDNGEGIDAEELPRLFQEFAQLSNNRRAGQGTGLGLALTRHLVEAQGGSVGVRSHLGRGSVFFAVLPLVYANSTPNT